MRAAVTLLHRWVGLAIAGFLVVSGLTGAVISWDHELDALLNPHLLEARTAGPMRPPLDLVAEIEARDPRIRVTHLPLVAEPGHSLLFGVDPIVDPATGDPYEPGYNQVFIDPASGAELGRRDWGAVWPITRANLVSFLYVLHYSLHIPTIAGIPLWGVWLLGIVALAWTIDCFVGLYLTLPSRWTTRPSRPRALAWLPDRGWGERWQPAWKIKTGGNTYRLAVDLHRAGALWTWGILLLIAFTGFSLNLYSELFYPILSTVSEVTPSPFDLREPTDPRHPIMPQVGYAQVIAKAAMEAALRGWPEPVGAVSYNGLYGIFEVGLFAPGEDHGAAGVGPAYLYYDGLDGRLLGDLVPWTGTAADIFVQAQFPLHSGRILGLPGRILISLMGLAVAGLAITGVLVWYRKRRARLAVRPRRQPAVLRGCARRSW